MSRKLLGGAWFNYYDVYLYGQKVGISLAARSMLQAKRSLPEQWALKFPSVPMPPIKEFHIVYSECVMS